MSSNILEFLVLYTKKQQYGCENKCRELFFFEENTKGSQITLFIYFYNDMKNLFFCIGIKHVYVNKSYRLPAVWMTWLSVSTHPWTTAELRTM